MSYLNSTQLWYATQTTAVAVVEFIYIYIYI